MPNLSRRHLVTTAAALPALAMPALASETIGPIHPDAELIALGDELLSLWPEFVAARDAFNESCGPDGRPEEIRFCAINDQVSAVANAIPEIPSHPLAGLRVKEWRQSMRQTPIIGTDHSTNWTGTDRRLGR